MLKGERRPPSGGRRSFRFLTYYEERTIDEGIRGGSTASHAHAVSRIAVPAELRLFNLLAVGAWFLCGEVALLAMPNEVAHALRRTAA